MYQIMGAEPSEVAMEDDAADLVTIDQALMTANDFGFRTRQLMHIKSDKHAINVTVTP
jgi:hypothetical protein